MKILMVNKFFYIKGGSETYYFALKNLLQNHGHEVIDFSMTDDKNRDSKYRQYFVTNVDYNGKNNLFQKMKMAFNIIYSVEAKNKFEKLIKSTNPDIVHLHIFQHQISPSILSVLKKYKIPTVYTAHDLKMLCLNYKMMHDGVICEQCKNGKFYYCVQNKCVKNSVTKSLINMIEGYFHKWKRSYDVIDMIITPSLFYKKKFQEFHIPSDKTIHIPNFLDSEEPKISKNKTSKKYYLYFGRLSEEKGIFTLIKAVMKSTVQLYIIGTGPMETEIVQYLSKNQIHNIHLLGYKSGKELQELVGNAKAVILPSEWYENGPYSAIEALQLKRPLIGSDLGGIPELIWENKNGYVFENKNIVHLKKCIEKMENLSELKYNEMEECSGQIFKKYYTAEVHYNKLLNVYKNLLRQRRKL